MPDIISIHCSCDCYRRCRELPRRDQEDGADEDEGILDCLSWGRERLGMKKWREQVELTPRNGGDTNDT